VIRDYRVVPLGEVVTPVSRPVVVEPLIEFPLLGIRLDGGGPFLRETKKGAELSAKKVFRVKTGDFIYSRLFAWRGAFGVISEAFDTSFVSNEFPTFEPKGGRIDVRFLSYWFRLPAVLRAVEAECTGSTPLTRNRYKEEHFLRLQIPLPRLEVQRRIVERIDEIAARLNQVTDMRRRARKDLATLSASVLDQVFQPRQTWAVKTVTDLCETPQYGYTASAASEPIGPQMLRISDIQDGRVDWSSVPYCDCPDPEPYSLSAGDILFARTGATTGKSFLIDECPPSVFASYLIRLRVRSLVTPEYLHSFFQSPSYWRQITAGSRGTGQPNCNGKTLAQVRVPVPPIAEQSRMMSVLDDFRTQVSKVSRVYDNAEAEFDALLPSVLDQAFKGEL